MNQTQPSHVALLVPSVRKAADYLRKFDFQISSEEKWDGEGTLEIYVEQNKSNSLLLMEPFKAGAYQRALDKRGPGLHHLAIDVINLENFLESLEGSGWLLHPISIKTIKKVQTAYLARPGFPALIEVHERNEMNQKSLFVNKINLPFNLKLERLLAPIGCSKIVRHSDRGIVLSLDKHKIHFEDLL